MPKENMNLKDKYQKEVVPYFMKEKGVKNALAVPRLEKIVVSMGLGEALKNKNILPLMSDQLSLITGQKPIVTKAKKAVSAFKLRAGMPIGLKTTLRGKKMYDFLERVIAVVLPRVRDFRGLSKKSFDGQGNYTIGFSEMIVFPEVDYEKLDKVRGLEATLVTSAPDDQTGFEFLQKLGIPFEKK